MTDSIQIGDKNVLVGNLLISVPFYGPDGRVGVVHVTLSDELLLDEATTENNDVLRFIKRDILRSMIVLIASTPEMGMNLKGATAYVNSYAKHWDTPKRNYLPLPPEGDSTDG